MFFVCLPLSYNFISLVDVVIVPWLSPNVSFRFECHQLPHTFTLRGVLSALLFANSSGRSFSKKFFVHSAKIIDISKAHGSSSFGYITVAQLNQIPGVGHPEGILVGDHRLARDLAEKLAEIGLAEPCDLGQFGNRIIFPKIFLNVGNRLLHPVALDFCQIITPGSAKYLLHQLQQQTAHLQTASRLLGAPAAVNGEQQAAAPWRILGRKPGGKLL